MFVVWLFIYLLVRMASTTYQPNAAARPARKYQYLLLPLLSILAFTAYKVYQYHSIRPLSPVDQAIDKLPSPSSAVPTPSPSTEMQGKYSVG